MKRFFLILALCSLYGCAQKDESDLYDSAVAAYDKQDYLIAIKYCDEIVAMNPSYADAYIARGDSFTLMGNPDKGIEDETRGLSLNPDNEARIQALVDRSSAYADKKMWDNEIADYQGNWRQEIASKRSGLS